MRILLIGAGFSRNWGGWLASEVMGELCGRLQDRPWLVQMLQKMSNFEAVYGMRRETAVNDAANEQAQIDVARLEQAIAATFRDMNTAFADPAFRFEFSNLAERSLGAYLSRFDAIYSLNQDLLLDLHYLGPNLTGSKWGGRYLPGIEMSTWHQARTGADRVGLSMHVSKDLSLGARSQPLFKLHGSTNWVDGDRHVMVVGTGKEQAIKEARLLSWYQDLFRKDLFSGGTQLMCIGYGFMDEHINQLLVDASREAGLAMYLVNPTGPQVLSNLSQSAELERIPLLGVSVRSLRETFSQDDLSFKSFQRFLDPT